MKTEGTYGCLALRKTSPIPLLCHQPQYGSRALEESAHLLLGRLILEAGVLQVVSPHGLVLVIRGAQELDGLLDGHGASINLISTDPVSERNTELGECSAKSDMSAPRVIGKESMIKYYLIATCSTQCTSSGFLCLKEREGKRWKRHSEEH